MDVMGWWTRGVCDTALSKQCEVAYTFSEGQACGLYTELEAAIISLARFAGLESEPELVNLILQEVAAQRDSLPLLEYALKEMWRNQQN
jgi:hypothetical protein